MFAVQGEAINSLWKDWCVTLTSVTCVSLFGVINLCV